jgi:hypothetical protein
MHSMLADVENVGQNWYNSRLTSSVTENGNEWNEFQCYLSNQSKLTLSYALSCSCVILSTNKESHIIGNYKNLFVRALETGRKASLCFSRLCRSECKLILYLTTMYIYCLYPAISKSQKQLPNCLKIADTSAVHAIFQTNQSWP